MTSHCPQSLCQASQLSIVIFIVWHRCGCSPLCLLLLMVHLVWEAFHVCLQLKSFQPIWSLDLIVRSNPPWLECWLCPRSDCYIYTYVQKINGSLPLTHWSVCLSWGSNSAIFITSLDGLPSCALDLVTLVMPFLSFEDFRGWGDG